MSKRELAKLKRKVKHLGITHDEIAYQARVYRASVSNWFSQKNHFPSRNILETVRRLITKAEGEPSMRPGK